MTTLSKEPILQTQELGLCLSLTELEFGPVVLPPDLVSCLLCAIYIVELRTVLKEILPIVLFLFFPNQM